MMTNILGMAVTKDGKRREEALCLWLVRKILKCSIYCSHCDGAFCEMQFVAIDLDQLVLTCIFDIRNGGKHFHEMP